MSLHFSAVIDGTVGTKTFGESNAHPYVRFQLTHTPRPYRSATGTWVPGKPTDLQVMVVGDLADRVRSIAPSTRVVVDLIRITADITLADEPVIMAHADNVSVTLDRTGNRPSPLFAITVEGRVARPRVGDWNGRPFAAFELVHDRGDRNPMYVEVMCWNELYQAASHVEAQEDVFVELTGLRAAEFNGTVTLVGTAGSVARSLRHVDVPTGPRTPQRCGDVVVTAEGEHVVSHRLPDLDTDRELVHN